MGFMSSDTDLIALQVPSHVYATVDSQMHNAASSAIATDDDEREDLASSINEASEAQVPWVDGNWPPMDQVLTISLTRAQWSFVVRELEDAYELAESAGTSLEIRGFLQNAIYVVTAQLAAH
jgi:hypothetical protein